MSFQGPSGLDLELDWKGRRGLNLDFCAASFSKGPEGLTLDCKFLQGP